jgi:SAM-dependent methyltransferase
MVGYGMNAAELSRNQHLTKHVVRDLNLSPILKELEDKSADVVICNVSVDYLIKPIDIFGEMRRVLKDGGTAHMAFSDRFFPTKVIGKWMGMNDEERRKWVGGYFWASGGWKDVEEVILKEGTPSFMGMGGQDPLYVVRATKI